MATTSGVGSGVATGAFTTLLVGDSMQATMQFQLYTFQVDFLYQQQTGRQVVL